MSAESTKKAANQRFNACMNRDITHVRVGETPGTGVSFIGMARELHGTVCTCCKRKAVAA